MLLSAYNPAILEAGCDEAGRGCLAGPVYAAAVILPPDYQNPLLDDSKRLSALRRQALRPVIQNDALAWAVASVSPEEIDEINILNASFLAMHRAVDQLELKPDLLLIDGPRFNRYPSIDHLCQVKGDARFASIAAASILAKTYRDDYMTQQANLYPPYAWERNMGYPSPYHFQAILEHGLSPLHRRSFRCYKDPELFDAL